MKTTLTPFNSRSDTVRKLLRIASASLLLLSFGQRAQAQFPRVESFQNGTANGFDLFGTAKLTGTGTTGGTGYLRLTDAVGNQAGTAIDQGSFPAPQGFSISFEFFSYGKTSTTGADGFSVYLIDGNTSTFRIGADGGSLGYAQRIRDANKPTEITPGVSNGYVGIGIDEFGNFSNASEGRSGGLVPSGLTPNAITIRGKGNGTDATEYPYLASSGQLDFKLDVGTARAQETSGDYRRAFIDFIPFTTTNGSTAYRITVRIQNGALVTTALSNIELPPPPPTLRIGFSGSTGGSNNVHEIRNLAIVRPTIANNDRFGTRYGTAASFDLTVNDEAPGSSLNRGTVDLNPSTAAVEQTLTVAGKGTFTVNAQGVVTFSALNTFAGIVTIPYTIRDILGTLSNQATITVDVSGADLASSVSGPTTANPGSPVTYVVSTNNLGLETANNVVPTLTLPSTATNINRPAGSSIATVNGAQVITFAAVTSLAPNAPAIVNAVTFTMPTGVNTIVTGTAGATSNVPDPTLANNTATVSTLVSGIVNVATGCATPGNDGPATITAGFIPNTYFPGSASVAAGATAITVGASTGSSTAIKKGDLLLVMQMQGAQIRTDNTTRYGSGGNSGSGSTSTDYTAGTYEYAIAANDLTTAGGTLQLVGDLANAYQNADFIEPTATANTGSGQRRFQVIRVPQYSSLTINGTVNGTAWNGSTGGVLVVDVAGRTTFGTSGRLDMSGRGFRGGAGVRYTGNDNYDDADYRNPAATTAAGAHGSKGEGFVGTPRFVNNDGQVTNTGIDGYPRGSVGAGAPGNAGGGGTDAAPDATGNDSGNGENTGGGGGGNGGSGGTGGGYSNENTLGGKAGVAAGSATAGRLFLGGGGGAGSTNSATPTVSSGADGGGIIILRTGSVAGTGTITANGDAATNNASSDGGGGGGAGGTVVLSAQVSTGLINITVSATGGKGGNSTNTTDGISYGAGGGGGGGLIYANNTLAGASSAIGGAQGVTRTNGNTNADGDSGDAGTIRQTSATANIPDGIASSTACMPTLTAALSTSTPNVTRNGNAVNPATYSLVVSNTGGSALQVNADLALTNDLFKYDNTVAPTVMLTLADGSSTPYTSYSGPTISSSTPTFSNLAIPAGATLRISFRATVASTAVNNTAYGASATVRFLDPTRTALTGQVSPAGTFAGGGTVPGSNYAAASSTAEDVTIVRPLPVELKQFTATAVRQDAQLNWATASELNNDRFVVERSLDGLTFSAIGTVQGKGTSSQQSKYSFTDAGAARFGTLLYYRLKQLDFDGTATFSPVRTVKFVDAIKVDVSVYPNPTQGGATLDLTGLPAGDYQVQLLDLTGRSLQQFTFAGQREHALPVQALPHGSYIVRVRGAAVSVALPLVRN